jgi:lysophospholipase L1-like esterase
MTDPSPPDTLRLLALGDSYTIGERVEPAERWPVLLVDALRKHDFPFADPLIIARTGWRTDQLADAIERLKPVGPFDLVTLLIGVNDQYQHRTADDYRPRFVALLKQAVALAGGSADRVLVVSIPDYGVTPFVKRENLDPAKIAAEIDRFNAVNREETKAAGARYVEITKASRRAATDPALVANDGLHPSGTMYAQWAAAALPVALAALKRKAD